MTLAELVSLSTDELQELRTQGFVCREQRGGCVVYKLRFRLHERQRVRYLGTNEAFSQLVAAALADHQCGRRHELKLKRIVRAALRCVRDTKQQLAPVIPPSEMYFHGSIIRFRRRRHNEEPPLSATS